MPTYRFTEYPLTARKSVPCTVCRKKVRRQRTFSQTLNPFNKNDDGSVKTVPDIYRALRVQAEVWQAEPETHPRCEAAA
ncbi:hypothetical protein [Streptomyces xanthochromogenes]